MRYEVHENELTDNQREMRYEKRRTRKNDLFFFFFFPASLRSTCVTLPFFGW